VTPPSCIGHGRRYPIRRGLSVRVAPPTDWANESPKFAKRAYLLPGSAEKIEAGEKLDEAYADFALSIIQRRLAQAGVRLANELNEIFAQSADV